MIRRLQSRGSHADVQASSLQKSSSPQKSGTPPKKKDADLNNSLPQDKIDLSQEAQVVLAQYALAKRMFEKLKDEHYISKIAARLCVLCVFMRYLLVSGKSFEEMAIWRREHFLKASEDLIWSMVLSYVKSLPSEEKNLETQAFQFTLDASCFIFHMDTEPSFCDLFSIDFEGKIHSSENDPDLDFSWTLMPPEPENQNMISLSPNLSILRQNIVDLFQPVEIEQKEHDLYVYLDAPFFDSNMPSFPLSLQGIALADHLEDQYISLQL